MGALIQVNTKGGAALGNLAAICSGFPKDNQLSCFLISLGRPVQVSAALIKQFLPDDFKQGIVRMECHSRAHSTYKLKTLQRLDKANRFVSVKCWLK